MEAQHEYNVDELVAPEWMNSNFFEDVLSKYQNNATVNVSECVIKPGSKPGEHYASIMFRAKITYKSSECEDEKTVSLIIKTTPIVEGFKKELLAETSAFDVEMKMYGETLPEVHRLMKVAGDSINTPKLIFQSNEPVPTLIFEDVCPQGYHVRNVLDNLEEIKTVAASLGKFHAASFYMSKNGGDVQSYNKSIHNTAPEEVLYNVFGKNFHHFAKLIRTWEGFEKHAEKFEQIQYSYVEKTRKVFVANEEGFGYNVLNHNDFHIKNLMFKNNEDAKTDILMLDFQLCYYGTPAIDVMFLLSAIPHYDVSKIHREEIICEYYEAFSTTLEKIGFMGKIPTLLDLQIELLRHGFIEVLIDVCALHFFSIDMSKYTLEDLFANPDIAPGMLTKEYQDAMKTLTTRFLYQGLLD